MAAYNQDLLQSPIFTDATKLLGHIFEHRCVAAVHPLIILYKT